MSRENVVIRRGPGARTNVALTAEELQERIAGFERYDRLSRTQAEDLATYRTALHLKLEEQAPARREHIRELAKDPKNIERGSQPSLKEMGIDSGDDAPEAPVPSRAGLRDSARRRIDLAHRSGQVPAHAAERAEHLVTDGPAFDADLAARWVCVTGDDNYRTAFCKKLSDPDSARDLWTPQEAAAWRAVASFQSEVRAMSGGTDSAGGYMVPFQLDPSILLTSDGSLNPLRQIARVEQVVSGVWHGVSSAGVTAEWLSEGAESGDDSPSLDQPEVAAHRGSAFVPYSMEVGQDVVNFSQQLARLLTDAADQLQAEAFTVGDGSGKPYGVVTGATKTVDSTTAGTLSADDVYAVQAALGARFQAGARFAANLGVINALDQLETSNGSKVFAQLGQDRLLRKPVAEISGMADVATGNKPLLYGDFSQFLIVDRIGSTIELVPHLFGQNRRPTGQRGLYLNFRTGSKVLIPEAFRALSIA